MLGNDEMLVAEGTADGQSGGTAELVVSQLYVLPETIQAADAVTLGADVRNDGNAESGAFQVRFTLDNSETHDVEFPTIPAGGSHWEEWQHAPLDSGAHLFSVQLDVQDQVREGNKYDNTASLPFQVTGALSLDLGATELTSSDSGLDSADAGLFSLTIPAPLITRVGSSVLVTVYFGHDDFVLDTANLTAVEALAEQLHFMLKPDVTVDGYASGEGQAADNQKLSEMRRQAVIALLSQANDGAQFGGTAHGAADFAEAETGKGDELEAHRAQNRRVTIFVMGLAEPDKPKPPDLKPHPKDVPDETEILEEGLNRLLGRPSKWPGSARQETSVVTKFWEAVDDIVNDVSEKLGIPKEYRGKVRDAAHTAIEKGSEELLNQGVDQLPLDQTKKDALKAGIKAGIQAKF